MDNYFTISIGQIKTEAIIGCYDYERTHIQPLIINLKARMSIDLQKLITNNDGFSDDLAKTVDYDHLREFVINYVKKTQYKLLESLIKDLATQILMQFKLIEAIDIEAIKPVICQECEIKVAYFLERKALVAIALGTSCEHMPLQQLIGATELLARYFEDIKLGGIYVTKPFGGIVKHDFMNTAFIGKTTLKPAKLLAALKKTEKLMGKQEIMLNGPRIIDIDIIFYDDLLIKDKYLQIPHPRAHLRDFVLKPLVDIMPDLLHPELGVAISKLLASLPASERYIKNQVLETL